MQVSRNNLLFVLLFAGGILLPTAILSVLSFRNIQNETDLARQRSDKLMSDFKADIQNAITEEQSKIYQEIKSASQFLYEQPTSVKELGRAAEFKSVYGVDAFFLFNKGEPKYPSLLSKNIKQEFANTIVDSKSKKLFQKEIQLLKHLKNSPEDSASKDAYIQERKNRLDFVFHGWFFPEQKVQDLLGLVRLYYKTGDFDKALYYLEIIEHLPHPKGYLYADIRRSANLLHFEILVKQKKKEEAEQFTEKVIAEFWESPLLEDLGANKFFFETAINQILSFDNLKENKRDYFWNLKENFIRQINYTEIFNRYPQEFKEILSGVNNGANGIVYGIHNNLTLLKMSSPYLSGDQVVVVKINRDGLKNRLLNKLKPIVKRVKNIPFSITEQGNKIFLGEIPDSATVVEQVVLHEPLQLEFSLYEKDIQDVNDEANQRKILMVALISFALITVILGTFFMFRFFSQEHKLLSMKANFLSSVSHELKTPLTSIKMFAEMMARGRLQRAEKVQEYSTLIGKEASRLENLIGAILNYTRMEHGTGAFKWERLDFSVCVRKVFDAIEDIGVEKGLTFFTQFEPNTFVIGDYTALYSLVQNLIDNAIKYTNAPGDITIKVFTEDNRIVFTVADTGVGIPISEQKNIFNDFYRVGDEMTRSTKGSGIGLATVKRVAETHKATISLISKPLKGSTFIVKFKKAE